MFFGVLKKFKSMLTKNSLYGWVIRKHETNFFYFNDIFLCLQYWFVYCGITHMCISQPLTRYSILNDANRIDDNFALKNTSDTKSVLMSVIRHLSHVKTLFLSDLLNSVLHVRRRMP